MKEELLKILTWYAKEKTRVVNPEQHAKDCLSLYMESIAKANDDEIPQSIGLCSNGNAMVFDKEGEQMYNLQVNVDTFYFEFLELQGIDPTKIDNIVKTVNGVDKLVKPFKKENGEWNSKFLTPSEDEN